MSYRVKAEPEVGNDLDELARESRELVRVAIKLMLDLRSNPWLGDDLWERYTLRRLKDCRRVRFDLPDRLDKPRFRIVCRNEPADRAPALVRVWSVGPRRKLIAYTRAVARIRREEFRERRRRQPGS